MKKTILTTALLTMAGIGFMAGSASAYTITYADTTINFPGYTPGYTSDEIGTPKVASMTVKYDETASYLLQSVEFAMTDRRVFDTLFLDTDGVAGWDYMIRDNTGGDSSFSGIFTTWDSQMAEGVYEVDSSWAYTLVQSNGRNGHPNGIAAGDLTLLNGDVSFVNNAPGLLTYNLAGLGINLGVDYSFAYASWCANDVMIVNDTVVPEPATMLLFGTGLAGLAGVARRRKMK